MMKTLFTGVRILDCTGAEPYAGEVLLAGNRIAEVVRSPARAPRDQAAVIDGRGATLMPGLIESHGRLSIDNADDLAKIGMVPPEETTLIAARNATLYLDCGITSCISAASAKPQMDVVIRNAIQKGEIPGPRLLAASPWLTVTGGLGDMRTQHMPHITSMAPILGGPDPRWAGAFPARDPRAHSRRSGYYQADDFRGHVCPACILAHHGDERGGGGRRGRSRACAWQTHERARAQRRLGQARREIWRQSDLSRELCGRRGA